MKSAALYGILILAHGGAPRWDAEVARIRRAVDARVPAEAALGMADAEAIQGAVDRLERRGVKEIVAVPLFVNSDSEVLDQARFVLGLRREPSRALRDALAALPPEAHMQMAAEGHHHAFSSRRVALKVPIVMAPALDDHSTLIAILLSRARALSKDPTREIVVLVAHGPVDERANAVWLATLGQVARRLEVQGGFADVRAATLRDDSLPAVKSRAIAALREIVAGAGDRVLVVPVLIARGGIEDHVVEALKGLSYSWDGMTICPDPRIADWIVESGVRRSEIQRRQR